MTATTRNNNNNVALEMSFKRIEGAWAWFKLVDVVLVPHRDGDLPAVFFDDGTLAWYQDGKMHRDHLPAVVFASGAKMWVQHGKLHRDGDLPAVIRDDGAIMWYQNGELHREGNQPAVIFANGEQEWYRRGEKLDDPISTTEQKTETVTMTDIEMATKAEDIIIEVLICLIVVFGIFTIIMVN